MKKQCFFITQNVIIKDDNNRILILRHSKSGKWLLPGGRINQKEQWKGALTREIKEETGITNWIIQEIFDVDSYITTSGDYYYLVVFVCKIKDKEVVLSEEHDQYVWLSNSKELLKYEFWHSDIPRRITHYLQDINNSNLA